MDVKEGVWERGWDGKGMVKKLKKGCGRGVGL